MYITLKTEYNNIKRGDKTINFKKVKKVKNKGCFFKINQI